MMSIKYRPLYIATFTLLLASCVKQQPISHTPTPHAGTSESPQITTVPPRPPVTQQRPQQQYPYPPVTRPAQPPQSAPVAPKPSYHSFADWKADFMQRAIANGYNPHDLQRLLANAYMNERVVSLDSKQPEFAKMPWEYADSAVSDNRVSNGRRHFANQRTLLSQLESRYGVNAEIVAGIWGMESAYGAVTGKSNLPSALASLAYDGRRQAFAEKQLLALLQLMQRGDVYESQMQGSWAGGMGQTQFIPATWLQEGVDGDGDGRRNPWATADALTSTASYLRNSGWVRGLDPFYEVKLPPNFNYHLMGIKQPFAQWRNNGVMPINGAYIDENTPLELWLPAGKEGPALLISKNFDVIKVYNNSSSYALGVSLLGKAIAKKGGLRQSWPRYEKPLTTSQVTNLQRNLTNAGYDTRGVDGVIGTNTRKAFSRWQADNGQIPDGFITQRSAGALAW